VLEALEAEEKQNYGKLRKDVVVQRMKNDQNGWEGNDVPKRKNFLIM